MMIHDKTKTRQREAVYALYIDCDGKVYPCNKFLYVVGNIKTDTLHDIWYNSGELHRIQDMRWSDLIKCPSCSHSDYCQRCPGTAWLEDGDEYAPSSMSCQNAYIRKNYIHKVAR